MRDQEREDLLADSGDDDRAERHHRAEMNRHPDCRDPEHPGCEDCQDEDSEDDEE